MNFFHTPPPPRPPHTPHCKGLHKPRLPVAGDAPSGREGVRPEASGCRHPPLAACGRRWRFAAHESLALHFLEAPRWWRSAFKRAMTDSGMQESTCKLSICSNLAHGDGSREILQGPKIITNTIWGVPYYIYSISGHQTLFSLLRPLYYTPILPLIVTLIEPLKETFKGTLFKLLRPLC